MASASIKLKTTQTTLTTCIRVPLQFMDADASLNSKS